MYDTETFTMKLESPLTEEQLALIRDDELEHTETIDFTTPKGKQVGFKKIVYGKWLVIEDELWAGGGRYECSVCGYGFSFGAFHEMNENPYCPHCGARLEGEE